MEQYRHKNVLITGGLGFIGSNLARRLIALDAKVTLVDSLIPLYGGNIFNIHDIRGEVTINLGDVRDPHALTHLVKGQDYLFNLAGQTSHLDSMEDPETDLAINAGAQLSILEICRKVNPTVKIVFAGTRQVYGRPQYLPVDEEHQTKPVDVNGINKLAGEQYHRLYNDVYGIRTCVLRLTNTYGPRMRVRDARQTFLGVWIRQLLDGNPIQVYGDGLQQRDFNYVEDCVQALLLAGVSETSNGKVYNLGSDEVINLKTLAAMMTDLGYGGSYELVPFHTDRKVIDIGDYYSEFSLIRKDLGWTPKVKLSEGLPATLSYYNKHGQHYWA
jgi:dTDP-glucose 4,6-dehydratase/UDP-glucose 4-epimerase